MKLFNTLSRKIEDFIPLEDQKVGIYACGPTVYDYTHIGHIKKYVGDDILKRVLELDGYEVKHVMNITDVGHLTSDADEGDDKLEVGARQRDMSVWELVKYFEDYFFKSMDEVDIQRPNIVARATDHVNEQIKLIHKLIEKGFTYQTEQAIYFDISKFPNYTKLSGQKIDEKVVGARETVVTDQNKKHPADFALWLFTVGHFKDHVMRWSTPWGEGFPGWHIECSAMSMEYLGSTIDIHTGATEHIPVHHTNEIAQSEAATGQQFVRFWVHHGLLMVDGKKMSKSLKNFYTLDDVKAKGLDPLALRYLVLTAHYRDQLNFTWESLTSAQNALNNLRSEVRDWSFDSAQDKDGGYYKRFLEALNNDLNTPQALAIMWEMVKSDEPSAKKAATLLQMDKVLGLKLEDYIGKPLEIPQEVQDLVNQREEVRKQGDFKKSDELRHEIKKSGYEVEDTSTGPKIKIS